jgi:hypothetical protein
MSDIIYTPPASSGGGQNPTTNYIPLNNGTSNFVDSNIYNRKNVSTNYLLLSIDNPTDTITLGSSRYDFAGFIYNYGTTTNIEDIIFGNPANGNSLEFYLDWNTFTNSYAFLQSNSTGLYIDDTKFVTRKGGVGGSDIGLNIDFNNNWYFLGDFSNRVHGTYFFINDQVNTIETFSFGNKNGLFFDLAGFEYYIGDVNDQQNKTKIVMKDSGKSIQLFTDNGSIELITSILSISNTSTSTGAGGPSPLGHLLVTINGTPCKIQLLNT